jgi:predicted MFS family arabinose efflux permease
VLRSPQVFRVLTASLVGRLPSGSAPLALLLFARQGATISYAGLLVAAYTVGTAAGQPMLSRMADRWRQAPVMWAAVAVSTAGFLAAATRPGPAAAAVAALAAGLGAPPFEACLRVLWKDLVGDGLVHAAYTLDIGVQELIYIVGPLVTVAAIGVVGPAGALVAIAAVQVAGTAWFATAPAVRTWRGDRAPRHWAGPLRAARLRRLLLTTLLIGAGVGSTTVAITAYAESLGARSWAGWLLAVQAAGALTGGLVAARHPTRRSLAVVVTGLAVGYVPLLLVPALPVMAVFALLSGLLLPVALTGVFLTADRVATPGTAAESFAWVATAFGTGSAAGAALDGAVLGSTGAVVVGFVLAPLVILAGAAVARSTA